MSAAPEDPLVDVEVRKGGITAKLSPKIAAYVLAAFTVGSGGATVLARSQPQEVHVEAASRADFTKLQELTTANAIAVSGIVATVEAQAKRMDAQQVQIDRLLDALTTARRPRRGR